MKLLITGVNGYLGNVLNSKIDINMPHVHKIDLGIFKHKTFDYTRLDLSIASFSNIFYNQIDTIVHLAGVSNDPSAELDADLTHRMNVEASKRLIDFASAVGVKRFIFASSASVYGSNSNLVTETSEVKPLTAYAKSKKEIEDYLLDFKDLNPIILRFGTLFGVSPKMRFDLAINLMVKDALLKGEVNVYGGGEQFRPFLHVNDAANLLYYLINMHKNNEHSIYNYSISNIKIKTLAEIIAEITKAKLVIHPIDSPDLRNYKMNSSLAYSEFPKPETSIVDGIIQVKSWCLGNEHKLDNSDYYTIKSWKGFLEGENSIL